MGSRWWCSAVVLLSLAPSLGGCDKLGFGDKKDEATNEPAAATNAPTTPAPTPPPPSTQNPPPTTATTPTGAPPPGTAVTVPGMPRDDEFAIQAPVEILNGKQLGCEAKAVREWVRVQCKDKNDTGGTPTTVSLTKGDMTKAAVQPTPSMTTLIYAFTEGTDIEAAFVWTDKPAKFKAVWPKGTPKPPAYGAFEGPPPTAGIPPQPGGLKLPIDPSKLPKIPTNLKVPPLPR